MNFKWKVVIDGGFCPAIGLWETGTNRTTGLERFG